MFFILSKLLSFLLRPIIWVLILFIGGLWTKKPKRKKKLLLLAFLTFYFFSNAFLFNLVVHWWETDNPEVFFAKENTFDVAILLGGYSDMGVEVKGGIHHLSGAGNRFHHALQLYKDGKFNYWLLTGGSGRLLGAEKKEADEVRDLLIQLGVEESKIIVENQSRNTRENAIYSKKILEEQFPEQDYLLISSAWHMPRAQACFEKIGLKVQPYSSDFKSKKIEFRPEPILLPNAGTLADWDLLIKEWIGYLVYKLKGFL